MKKIAIYGKGGIGKSTTVSNIAAALSAEGFKVMQIGCDPKADSTRNLTGGKNIPTVLNQIRDLEHVRLEDVVYISETGVICVEAGGPMPGVGCAGRGIITAFETLEELHAYEILKPDLVLYDVLGDVVCGGFSMPIRGGYADDVYIVTSGEMMSLYAAGNISYAVNSMGNKNYAKLKGYIQNSKNIVNEDALVEQAASESGAKVVFKIERNPLVQEAEALGQSVVSAFPDSELTQAYKALGRLIMEG